MGRTLKPSNRVWIVLGMILMLGVIGAAAYPVITDKIVQGRLGRVRADYRTLAISMSNHAADNCGLYYPDDTHMRRATDPTLPLTFERVFAYKRQGKLVWGLRCLTTPIAYMHALPQDPFNPGQDYGYTAFNQHPMERFGYNFMAILSSPGPDGKIDLPLPDLRAGISDLIYTTKGRGHGIHLTPQERGIIRQWIAPCLYDPSNGIRSGGDLILVEEFNEMSYGFMVNFQTNWTADTIVAPDHPVAMKREKDVRPEAKPSGAATALTQEEKAWVVEISIPLELEGILRQAKILTGPEGLDDERVHRLNNHLGAFREFFEHPGPLERGAPIAALYAWQQENPEWWTATAKRMACPLDNGAKKEWRDWRYQHYFKEVTAYDLYPVIILYGKTQLLLAAEEAARNATGEALARIAMLRKLMGPEGLAVSEELKKHDSNIARIHEEMNRLCDELEKSIQEKTRVKPETK